MDATETGGVWSVADADLTSLTDGNITVTALVTDDAGNTKEATDTLDLNATADADLNTVHADRGIKRTKSPCCEEADDVSVTLGGVDADA
ncbi:hypothetical protein [Vibrio cyclitrophicus]|uniref:hypothetical protein n=1 Tax=Vibrio cyclitrophicus TaxID=47951 RepID=UPI0038B2958A